MRVKNLVVSNMETNAYVVSDEETLEAIIIDPGAEAEKIIEFIEAENLKVNAIVLTHAHFDHIGAVKALKEKYNVKVMLCRGEEVIIENGRYNLSYGFGDIIELKADHIFEDGEIYKFGNLQFKVFITPGHTPGGGCYYFENEGVLFSGDTLFQMSVGRSDFILGDGKALIKSIKEKLMTLPDEVIVFTGHGERTTVGFERKNNFFIR